ncbi:MAG: cob(I)yrinic acid a,c-diamide adenosyltransferase [Planctomycetia bacterium]|nr:cob(I)yrinic acid a,c-diamide adenosyltransferase [Planctomycetia bacterium]
MSSKIYTKTGDTGETGLFGGPRVLKDNLRIEAYGAVDELNAVLGLVCAEEERRAMSDRAVAATVRAIQHDLFAVGAELATPDPVRHGTDYVGPAEIERLEQAIDRNEEALAPLTQFILPGGTPTAAQLHVARTVCRRAERRVVTLARSAGATVSNDVIIYLNRLSDLLFVLARRANADAGRPDEAWQKPSK